MTSRRIRELWPLLFPLAAAELGVRLLAPPEPPPAPRTIRAQEYFEEADMRRARRFVRPQLALALLRQGVRLGALAVLAARAGGPRRRRAMSWQGLRPRPDRPALGAAALEGARVAGTLTAASLPLSAVARRRAIAVGLDTQSWTGWAADVAKATAIGETLAAGSGAAMVWVTHRFPRGWWLPAAVGSVAAGGLFGTLAPVLLEPLFNDFTALPEGRVRSEVLELAQAAGVRVGEVYSVDASRRTSGANAYVTGLGPTKRVVLYDTLLDRYSHGEIRVVVAHELSHVRHRDVMRGLVLSAVVSPPAAKAIEMVSRRLSSDLGTPKAIPALLLASFLVAAPVGMVSSRLSRAIERRADAESLELSSDPEAFISFQRAIALQNVADVEPPRWARVLLASHPHTLERIGAAVEFRDRGAGSQD
ncbi:MAG: M48 family metalloprotease [Solirubrobacteraceae bacterium]